MRLGRKRSAGDDSAGDSKGRRELVTPGNAKKALAIGKILTPVLMPVAIQLAGMARGAWDERRARRLGVPASALGNYSGKGGALHARIDRVAISVTELTTAASGGRATELDHFVRANGAKLADLSAAVRAAEMMPTERRRAAHKAVASELDQIEPQLLTLLGVGTPNGSDDGPDSRSAPA